MYKILIRSDGDPKLWTLYSNVMSSGRISVYEIYETDDSAALVEKLKELDKEYGSDNLMVVQDIDYTVAITLTTTETTTETTEETTGTT